MFIFTKPANLYFENKIARKHHIIKNKGINVIFFNLISFLLNNKKTKKNAKRVNKISFGAKMLYEKG